VEQHAVGWKLRSDHGLRVNYDFFDTLGVKMQLGRTFRSGADTVAEWHVMI